MFSRILLICLTALCLLLSGCATPTKMAFSDDSDPELQKITKPVFLMTTTIKNTYRTSFQPRLIVVHVERAIVKDSADRISFTIDEKAKVESDSVAQGNFYLLRMELEKGEYAIRGLSSLARSFPINGFFFAPLHAKLESSKDGVFYLGHIDATVRERKENEFKAGGSIPLIDQAIAGASTGTFDIIISDQWERDEAKFRSRFPALKAVTVQKAILPAFDRAKAQKLWEEN